MTLIVAAQFGDRICIFADTAISKVGSVKPDHLPGRLKAIVLGINVSVAYAGASDRAHGAIRAARSALKAAGPHAVLELLARESAASRNDWDDSVDYLVALHAPAAELRQISGGEVSEPIHRAWIGDFYGYKEFIRFAVREPLPSIPLPEPGTEERLTRDFADLIHTSGTSVLPGVGGSYVNLLASPHGHCYQDHAASASWMPINLAVGRTARHDESRRTGEAEWVVGCASTSYRGVAVVALYLPQARLAYIHAPVLSAEPVRFPLLDPAEDWLSREHQMLSKLSSELDRIAEVVGGGVMVD